MKERCDVHYNLTKPPENPRQAEQEHIEKMTAQFLRKKAIQQIPQGVSGYSPNVLLRPKQRKNSVIEALAQGSKAKVSSRIWNNGA